MTGRKYVRADFPKLSLFDRWRRFGSGVIRESKLERIVRKAITESILDNYVHTEPLWEHMLKDDQFAISFKVKR